MYPPNRAIQAGEGSGAIETVGRSCIIWCRDMSRFGGIDLADVCWGRRRRFTRKLGLSGEPNKFADAKWGGLAAGHAIGEPAALFPRKDTPPKT